MPTDVNPVEVWGGVGVVGGEGGEGRGGERRGGEEILLFLGM